MSTVKCFVVVYSCLPYRVSYCFQYHLGIDKLYTAYTVFSCIQYVSEHTEMELLLLLLLNLYCVLCTRKN